MSFSPPFSTAGELLKVPTEFRKTDDCPAAVVFKWAIFAVQTRRVNPAACRGFRGQNDAPNKFFHA
jgi:hypothetical protein